MYFCYELNKSGHYVPVKYATKPQESPAGSITPKRKCIVLLPAPLDHMSLARLSQVYPLPIAPASDKQDVLPLAR